LKKTTVIFALLIIVFFSPLCLEEKKVTPDAPVQTTQTTHSPILTTSTTNKQLDTSITSPTTTVAKTETSTSTTTETTTTQKQVKKQLPKAEDYELVKIADGFNELIYFTHAGDGSGRLFIAEQRGVIRILDKEYNPQPTPFLDITSKIKSGGERGLLGLAFHPQYKVNGFFYVHYSDKNGDTTISRFKVSDDPDKADQDSEEILFTHDQPFPNHNGGQIAFGPDEHLYIGLGDGGSGGDPLGNGQDPNTLLGTILRINVDDEQGYTIPSSNPFIGAQNGRQEVWAYGLRNPWRFSFDRLTGELYIGDVGQNKWEEINYQSASSRGGENYGWNRMEGSHCFIAGCNSDAYVAPIAEYGHGEGCSVTGGYVYRGALDKNLYGTYIYGDYCSGLIWALLQSYDGNWENKLFLETSLEISSFGEDELGEIYVIDHGGRVYLIKNINLS
jgi:glucose/arabinose dehydrogenase